MDECGGLLPRRVELGDRAGARGLVPPQAEPDPEHHREHHPRQHRSPSRVGAPRGSVPRHWRIAERPRGLEDVRYRPRSRQVDREARSRDGRRQRRQLTHDLLEHHAIERPRGRVGQRSGGWLARRRRGVGSRSMRWPRFRAARGRSETEIGQAPNRRAPRQPPRPRCRLWSLAARAGCTSRCEAWLTGTTRMRAC